MGVEAGIDAQQPPEASQQQSSADEQQQGERHLAYNEQAAHLRTCVTAGGAPAFIAQGRVEIDPRELQCGEGAEDDSGKERDDDREQKHTQINADGKSRVEAGLRPT